MARHAKNPHFKRLLENTGYPDTNNLRMCRISTGLGEASKTGTSQILNLLLIISALAAGLAVTPSRAGRLAGRTGQVLALALISDVSF